MHTLRGGTCGSELLTIQSLHCSIEVEITQGCYCLYARFHNSLGCVVNALSENRQVCVYPSGTCWLYDCRHTGTSATYRRHVCIIACWVLFQQGRTKLLQIWRGIFCQNMQCFVIPFSRFLIDKNNEKILILNKKILIVYLTTFDSAVALYRKFI